MNQYSTKLTDNQYNAIIHIFDVNRKRNHSVQDILKGLFYILKTGCHWRMLPKDFPKWQLILFLYQKRWVIERTFSWFENFRRLAKDYEYLIASSEAMIQLAFISLMLNRIKKQLKFKQFLI